MNSIMILFGSMVIAGGVGFASEKTGFTRNGYLASIIICIGGAALAYFVKLMFGIGLRPPGLNAIVSSLGALIIVPTHWRKR
jgi:hypothetical protein